MQPCIHSSSEPADVKLQRAQASESAVTVGSVTSTEDVMIWVDTDTCRYAWIRWIRFVSRLAVLNCFSSEVGAN